MDIANYHLITKDRETMNNPNKYKILASAKDARRILAELRANSTDDIEQLKENLNGVYLMLDVLTNVIIFDIERDFNYNSLDD